MILEKNKIPNKGDTRIKKMKSLEEFLNKAIQDFEKIKQDFISRGH